MHAQYRDKLDGDRGKYSVDPIVNCLYRDDEGEVFVWFGYNNRNPHNVYLSVGTDNFFSRPYLEIVPGGLSGFARKISGSDNATNNLVPLATQNYGQPTKFVPGKHNKVFRVRYKFNLFLFSDWFFKIYWN